MARWRAVADLYHAYFTGLIRTVVTRRGHCGTPPTSCSGVSPPAAGTLSAGLENWLEPLSAGWRPAVSLSRQLIAAVHVEYSYEPTARPGSAIPAALDLEGIADMRACPASFARELRRWHSIMRTRVPPPKTPAWQPKTRFVCNQAKRRRPDGLEGYLRIRFRLRARASLVSARHLAAPRVDPKTAPGLAGCELAETAAGKCYLHSADMWTTAPP